MSVHAKTRADGSAAFMVRWREGGAGSVNRKRTFDREDDAREFDRRVRRLKQTGDPALFADEITLAEYVHGEWWPNYAERRLALRTQETYSTDLDLRILPRLGDLTLTQLRPSVIERFAADLERLGTGRATIVSTLSVLQGVMKRAVRDYNLSGNPVKQVDKPSQRREREPILITVEQVRGDAPGVPAPRRPTLGHADQPARVRRPTPGVRGAPADLGRDPAPHNPHSSDQARRPARASDTPPRSPGR